MASKTKSAAALRGVSPSLRGAAAAWLAESGLRVFPIKAGAKAPPIDGWRDAATADPTQLAEWFHVDSPPNIGVAAGRGLLCVDLDMKADVDGLASLRALAPDDPFAEWENTLTIETPSGGRHLYYKTDPERRIPNSVAKLGPGIDIRGDGGYVVGPGSEVGGKTYIVINKAPIADAPTWLLDAIAAAAPAERVTLAAPADLDTEAAIAQAKAYLAEAPAAIEGRGGNDMTYRVAARLKDLGISEDAARDLMLGEWNGRCLPPWSEDELAEVVGHAYAYGQNTPGSASVELMFDELPDDVAAPAANDNGRLVFMSPSDCATAPARGYILKGIIAPGDIACLFGAPGAGKSLMAPYLGYQVARGAAAFSRRTRRGGVFYVAAEDPQGMAQRIRALREVHGDAPDFLLVSGVASLLPEKGSDLATLCRAVAERRPALVIIDTLAVAFPGIDENSSEGMGRVVAAARKITALGPAVLIVHHDTKAEGDTPRGHSLFNGALDTAIKLTAAEKGGGLVRGKLTKNRNGSFEWRPAFRIATREIGKDEDGEAIRPAYAEEVASSEVQRPERLTAAERAALEAVAPLSDARGRAELLVWRAACTDAPSAMSMADERKSRLRAFQRISQSLAQKRRIEIRNVEGVEIVVTLPERDLDSSPFDDLDAAA
jgi:hypothetical protein